MILSDELRRDLESLGIEVEASDPESLRGVLVSRLAAFHPDKTGGQFVDEDQASNFGKVKKTLERLDRDFSLSSQLLPINQVAALVDVLARLQTPRNVESPTIPAERFKSYLKGKYALPKITSALVATVCLLLFSLLGSFRQNPLYKSVISLYLEDGASAWAHSQAVILRAELTDLESRETFSRLSVGMLRDLRLTKEADVDSVYRVYVSAFPFLSSRDVGTKTLEGLYAKVRPGQFDKELKSQQSPTDEIDEELETGVHIFESTEPDFLRGIKAKSAKLNKQLASDATALNSIDPKNPTLKTVKTDLNKFLTATQESLASFDASVKSSEEQVPRQKNAELNRADGRILRRLAALTALACGVFLFLWIRERSDERWVDFLSTDQGAEAILTRLCEDRTIVERQPPGFSLTEFTKIVATKDVPKMMLPIAGSLDFKRLGDISHTLIDKLSRRKVIKERDTPSIQKWFDLQISQPPPKENRSPEPNSHSANGSGGI
ncbi:MAG TPA: hypothetical protein VNG71_00970 [Pyrinomonadaceae bacterium]|nr:hypothetical protein [Pyrinomonadaceae bacterium]